MGRASAARRMRAMCMTRAALRKCPPRGLACRSVRISAFAAVASVGAQGGLGEFVAVESLHDGVAALLFRQIWRQRGGDNRARCVVQAGGDAQADLLGLRGTEAGERERGGHEGGLQELGHRRLLGVGSVVSRSCGRRVGFREGSRWSRSCGRTPVRRGRVRCRPAGSAG